MSEYGAILVGKELDRYFELHRALREFHELFNDPPSVNDRAIAIVGASFLDTLLKHMLVNFLVEDEREVRQLLDPERPIGTFWSRVSLVYCLGLIGKVIRDDLRLAARIRNRFAHTLDISFDGEPIRSWCLALKWHEIGMMKPPEGATPRQIFQVGVNQLISHLNGLVGVARLDRRQPRPDP